MKCLSLKIKESITKNQGTYISEECQEQVREELVEEVILIEKHEIIFVLGYWISQNDRNSW